MKFGEHVRAAGLVIKGLAVSIALATAGTAALAAPTPAAPAPAAEAVAAPAAAPAAEASAPAADAAAVVGSYVPMKPTPGKGMPIDGGIGLQDQYSPLGEYGAWIHDGVLLPIIIAITFLVLFLLLYVMARYNRRANPVPSKTSTTR